MILRNVNGSRMDLTNFERRLGYEFRDKGLLMQALTHSSYAYENQDTGAVDNERLEFIGDSVLGLAIGATLFCEPECLSEGDMTSQRARVVCEESLARAARALDLGPMLLLGVGEARSGGAKKDSNLSNAMEALFGAVFLEAGFDAACELVQKHMRPLYEQARSGQLVRDYKSRLLETVQSWKPVGSVRFRLLDASGEDHEKVFCTAVEINGERYGEGTGRSKKESEQDASRTALKRLEQR